MNTYHFKTDGVDINNWDDNDIKPEDFLSAIVIGSTLSPQFRVFGASQVGVSRATNFTFELPFGLKNLDIEPLVYDTRFQSIKEFLDKPYAVAGRVVALIVDYSVLGDLYDFKRDLDNYIEYKIGVTKSVFIGICNGTLSESYAPFGVRDNAKGNGITAIKFFDRRDLSISRIQDVAVLATTPSLSPASSRPSLSTAFNPVIG